MVRLTKMFGKPFCTKKSKSVTLNTTTDEPHKQKDKKQGTDEFKSSTVKENLNYAVGILASSAMGFLTPIILVAYGELTTLFVLRHTPNATISPSFLLSKFGGGETNPGHTFEQQMDALVSDSIAFLIAGTAMSIFQFLFCVITVMSLNNSAISKVGRMRRYYLKAILKQEMAWHDKQTTGFASSFTDNLNKIQEGTGEKIGIFIYLVASFVSSVIAAMFYGWKLTLVMTAICPVFIILTIAVAKVQTNLTTKEAQCYGEAGSVVEEVLSAIRTVVAYSGEDKEVQRYEQKLAPAHKIGLKSGVFVGIGDATIWMLIFWAYSLCFWYGTPLIIGDRDKENKVYTPGVLLIVLFGVVVGAMNLGFSVPYLESFAKARGSSKVVSSLLKRKPVINVNAGGTRLHTKLDEIEFKNVYFSYPARPDIQILKSLNFKVKKGESVALVGSSGSGKSTTIQLIERFYDPSNGTVNLNGTDIKNLDLKWVRSQIGLVGQEPVLFNTTIAENICCDLDVSKEEMERAAKEANAHNFIMKLPMGYDTNVGERGAQLSGGQKQRIAIARALIRKPGILLLDEATSALDVANEAIVQQALDKASKDRTTLIISHRLSSIRNVDRIIVMSSGQVIEQGTHSELMELKNHYYGLVSADASLQQSSKDGKVNQEVNIESVDLISSLNKVTIDNDSDSKNSVVTYNQSKASWSKMLSLNKPDMLYVIVGSLASFFMGCTSPISSVFLGQMFGILSAPDVNEVYSTTSGYVIAFIIVGIIAAISIFLQVFCFTVAGVRLVSRLKVKVFSAMLHQEMSWFDDEKHSVGALSAKLSGDASTVQGATGSKIGTLVQGVSTLGVGAVMSFFYSWQMTFVCLFWVLLILISLIIEGKVMDKEGVAESEALEAASKIAVEAVMSVRTVVSLGQENAIVERYNKALVTAERAVCKKLRYRGIVFAFGQTCMNFAYSVSMCFGGYLIARHNVPYKNIIIVSEALLFGAWILGHALSFVPNINLARIAAGHLFQIIERKPNVYSAKHTSSLTSFHKSEGNIDYKDVHFAYPTRPEIKILNGLKLSIAQGQTVALVGSSGSGKSTCIQLLQRFYDPVSGSVAIGDRDISSIPINYLRSELGLVSQEPVLFDRTIAENIAYGDNSREIPVAEVIDAAKRANIHNFISSLPVGYETRLGTQGAQLSGGQKQRIAIARALVRNPRILILDEATSALDTQSEKVVQEALDDAMKGRTCIIIAHRLSTIKHVDVICALNKGTVVEMGSHEQLLAKGGLYAQLLQQHSS